MSEAEAPGTRTVQAEDEISVIGATLTAGFGRVLSPLSTFFPGIALQSEQTARGTADRGTGSRGLSAADSAAQDRDNPIMRGLVELQTRMDPATFGEFLRLHEKELYPVLSRYGPWLSYVKNDAAVAAFDRAKQRWWPNFGVDTREAVVADWIPGQKAQLGSVSDVRRRQQQQQHQVQFERQMRTAGNIKSGLVATYAWGIGEAAAVYGVGPGGHVTSDIGAVAGRLGGARARLGALRDSFRAIGQQPVERPVAAMVAPDRGVANRGTGPGTTGLGTPPAPTAPPVATTPIQVVAIPPAGPLPAAIPAAQPNAPPVAPAARPATPTGPPQITPPGRAAQPVTGPPAVASIPSAPTAGGKFVQRARELVQRYGGRLADPDGALAEIFQLTGATNAMHSRSRTPELALIEHILNGPNSANVRRLIVVKKLDVGRTPDFVIEYTNGTKQSIEVTTVTSAPGRGAAIRATGMARKEETKGRPVRMGNIKSRLIDKGVAKPNEPLQLATVPAAAGRAGGILMIYIAIPTKGAEAMVRAAMNSVAPRLSPVVEKVTFGMWHREPDAAGITRRYITFERLANGSYREVP